MHFMNNKRQVLSDVGSYLLNHTNNPLTNPNNITMGQLANAIQNNTLFTDKNEYIHNVSKYINFDYTKDNDILIYNNSSNTENIFDSELQFNKFYAFINKNSNNISGDFYIEIKKNSNYLYKHALFYLGPNSNNNNIIQLLDNPTTYITENENIIKAKLIDKYYILVLNIEEKVESTQPNSNFLNINYYHSYDNNIKNMYFISTPTFNYLKPFNSKRTETIQVIKTNNFKTTTHNGTYENTNDNYVFDPISASSGKNNNVLNINFDSTKNNVIMPSNNLQGVTTFQYYNIHSIVYEPDVNVVGNDINLNITFNIDNSKYDYKFYHVKIDETRETIFSKILENKPFNFDYDYQFNKLVELTGVKEVTDSKLELNNETIFTIKPKELFAFRIIEKTETLSPNDIENLSNAFTNFTMLPYINNNKEYRAYLSNIMDFFDFINYYKNLSTIVTNEINESLITSYANTFVDYYKYVSGARFVYYFNFDYENPVISYYAWNDSQQLEKFENVTKTNEDDKLNAKYVLVYEYNSNVNETNNTIEFKHNFTNTTSVVEKINVMNKTEYNNNELKSGNIYIKKLRLQTNEDKFILIHDLKSWALKRLHVWVDNVNIINTTAGHSTNSTANKDDADNSDINAFAGKFGNANILLENVYDYSENIFKSGIAEVLDNGKQYIEITFNESILYNKIQNITLLTSIFDPVTAPHLQKFNNDAFYDNIYNTSLMFFDNNLNEVKDYKINFFDTEDLFKNHTIFLLKGMDYNSYTENKTDPIYKDKPNTFSTKYITRDQIMDIKDAHKINLKYV